MKESFWGTMILSFGVIAIVFIYFFQNITNTDQQNYNLLKETTEAAMYDSIDQVEYQKNGNIKINAEKFIENFIRRYAENASLSNTYVIEIYHISEYPPKVSLLVKSSESTNATGEIMEFDITNRIDAILETPY
ncbi:MAG: hypothetical protein E7157_01105 [Lactobacillales bacterium]|nr:hypothetical protein [Lactobacillales bacterium]